LEGVLRWNLCDIAQNGIIGFVFGASGFLGFLNLVLTIIRRPVVDTPIAVIGGKRIWKEKIPRQNLT
jgi:hypothetical protein